jgi:glycosyltransferase involved in cell wall biosynthesis
MTPDARPRLSVVIATYRRADDLDRCIRSVLAEPGDDFEVLIGDDGSPDHTPEVIARFAADPRVRSYRNEHNLGMQENYWKIMHQAGGDYVFILTDDDLLLPGALARVRAALDAHPDAGYLLSDLPTVDERTGAEVDLHRTYDRDTVIPPGIASVAHVARSAWVLSRQVFRLDALDWPTWERNRGNIFFQIIAAGRVLLTSPGFYIAHCLVQHTWFNRVHWEKFGRDRTEIEFNLAADRYRCMAAILHDRMGDPAAAAATSAWQAASLRAYLDRPYDGFYDLARRQGLRAALRRLAAACPLGPRERRELWRFVALLPAARAKVAAGAAVRGRAPDLAARLREWRGRLGRRT